MQLYYRNLRCSVLHIGLKLTKSFQRKLIEGRVENSRLCANEPVWNP